MPPGVIDDIFPDMLYIRFNIYALYLSLFNLNYITAPLLVDDVVIDTPDNTTGYVAVWQLKFHHYYLYQLTNQIL